jgi:hypothetical protein
VSGKMKNSTAKDSSHTSVFDETLRRMLDTPPKPHEPAKAKHKQPKKQKPAK